MENLEDPEVQAWMMEQGEYADSILSSIPGRDKILARMGELLSGTVARVIGIQRLPNGMIFYQKRGADEDIFKLYVRQGLDGEEKLLVDPETFREATGKQHAINYYIPSPKGTYVAYGVSASGSEEAELYVMETASGSQIEGPIERARAGVIGWLDDEKAYFYWRMQKLGPEAPITEKFQRSKVFFHTLGSDLAEDQFVFGLGVDAVDIPPTEIPFVLTWDECDYAFGFITTGVSTEYAAIYTVPLSDINGTKTPWKKICDASDKVSSISIHGNDLYLLTFKDASRFKVIKTNLDNPDLANAETVVPQGESVIQDMAAAQDALYVQTSEAGIGKVLRLPFDKPGVRKEIKLPLEGSVSLVGTHSKIDGVYLWIESWVQDNTIYEYNPATGEIVDTKLQPFSKYGAPGDLVSKEVKVKSHDGVMVPMSIVHKKGIKLDGTNPTYMTAYGAYGETEDPGFSLYRLPFYELGGIRAMAHIRGGGIYGEEWHMAGFKQTKPNTWKDFIACAEYLIEQGYTSKEYLAGSGGSAGGITIGRAITERPDLFAAAVISVGDLDMLRMETTPNGVPNIPEFGTVTIKEEFEALLEMSSYHHVKDGVAYPAVMLTHGMNDPRVEPWNTAKMGARLQAASDGAKPVILRLDFESGHGIGDTKTQISREVADTYAFILWQMGKEGFQPE
jgi:prolyl oligopeptidase